MIEIRIHGRGGQGNVAAAELLSIAAFHDGKFAQAFPSFGAERVGAPVQAFVRIDDKKIRTREDVLHPDYIIAHSQCNYDRSLLLYYRSGEPGSGAGSHYGTISGHSG
jgi:2-oxoacid:acceptor oxidoreductase gamma subunit (pyruvate/2-ketoisovalerate family)